MTFKEEPHQLFVGHDCGIEDHLDDFGVAGRARAHLLVGRIRREPTLVTGGRCNDTGSLEELAFSPPEAAERKVCRLRAGWLNRHISAK